MSRILIIEDEPVIRELLRDNLDFEGFEVVEAADLAAGRRAQLTNPDLVLLDVNLPDGDGIRQLQEWRTAGVTIPVVVCTVRDREIDVVRALEAGADDYVTKPFRIRELIARIKAVLRRHQPVATPVTRIGPNEINFSAREARRHGEPLTLTATEWTLLEYLSRNAGQVVSREQIMNHVWGVDELEDSRAVDVHISRLRRKLEPAGSAPLLHTVRGLGYRLDRA
ncbi:MAG TPA: response regulator transcription factor [Candidatus Ozemobacteraceae bacterium]|nr:response regulator transcription factor [Candidatus Ozemobacteraceae bacterium]